MASDPNQRERYDAVTIGQIRKRELNLLETHISRLNGLIRGCKLDAAQELLKGEIEETITKLQNLDAMAATEVMFSGT